MNGVGVGTAPVVLASTSPRRRRLIRALDIRVDFVDPLVGETSPAQDETPHDFVVRQSVRKAVGAARALIDRTVVIAADTTVFLAGRILGKPADEGEATGMLGTLRGREHTVLTGVTVMYAPSGRRLSGYRSTVVRMRACSDEEIAAYVASGRPMDKAGAYAVQDADFRPAAAVSGCYLNVVGLPLCVVAELLGDFGVRAGLRDGWELPPQCGECSLRGEYPIPDCHSRESGNPLGGNPEGEA